MKSVVEDIKKGSFKPVYLFYGEEAYLKQQYKNRLKDAVLPEGDTINLSIYSGKGIDVEEMINTGGYHAVLCRYRLLLITEDSGFLKMQISSWQIIFHPYRKGDHAVCRKRSRQANFIKEVNKKTSVAEFYGTE